MSCRPPRSSNYKCGRWENGAWHCGCGLKADWFSTGKGPVHLGKTYWYCAKSKACSFWLWEDDLIEALDYHGAPQDVIDKQKRKKRDGDIRDYCQRTPKAPRTRDAEDDCPRTPKTPRTRHAEDACQRTPKNPQTPKTRNAEARAQWEEEDDGYTLSDREPSPSSGYRDSSPTPLSRGSYPRRSGAPSPSTLARPSPTPTPSPEEAAPDPIPPAVVSTALPPQPAPRSSGWVGAFFSGSGIPSSSIAAQTSMPAPAPPSTPSRTGAPRTALGASAEFQPRTPTRNGMPRADIDGVAPLHGTALTSPSPGKRKLSAREFETYNIVIRALADARVNLSVKGQNALRDIIKEEDFWIGTR